MSLAISFSLTGRLYKTDEFYSSGAWLVRRASLHNHPEARAFRVYGNLQNGSYFSGYKEPRTSETTPDMELAIPKLDGYEEATLTGFTGNFTEVQYADLSTFEWKKKVSINVRYLPLLSLGTVMIKSEGHAVIAVDENGSTVIALVMPIRRDQVIRD